jgi:tetratricopeptide (TPR) repeat protein
MSWLGRILFERSKLPDAGSVLAATSQLSRRVLGKSHYTSLSTMNHLGLLYAFEGRFKEEERLLSEALELARQSRGNDRRTLALMGNLAWAHLRLGAYAVADRLSDDSLKGMRLLLGRNHTGIGPAVLLRATVFNSSGMANRAKELLKTLVEDNGHIGREGHESWIFPACALAEAYETEGEWVQAESLLGRALAGARQVAIRGEVDDRPWVLNGLADLQREVGRSDKAEPLLIEAGEALALLHDRGSPLVADTAASLARVRLGQDRAPEAESQARRALAIRLDRHPDHWTRFDALSLLGASLAGQGKFAEAEPMLLEAYNGLKERQERIPYLWRKKRPAEAAVRLVELYEAWGKKDLADEWRKRVDLESELPADVFEP